MMAYQVRNQRIAGEKRYSLTYGKGTKQFTCVMEKTPAGWTCTQGDGAIDGGVPTMKGCKEAWGKWAAAAYEGVETPPMDAPTATPTPTAMAGPPKYAPSPKPVETSDIASWLDVVDPFDPRLRHPGGSWTALGVLQGIQEWHERYRKRIADINHALAMRETPGFNPFDHLRAMIDDCLARELPPKETDAQDPPTKST